MPRPFGMTFIRRSVFQAVAILALAGWLALFHRLP